MSSTPEPPPQPSDNPRPASRWRPGLLRKLGDVLDLVFPPSCVSCHGIVDTESDESTEATIANVGRSLCASCRRRIHLVGPPHCTTCGHPFFGELAENVGCAHCETLVPQFGAGRTATLLQGPMRDVVHALKYHGAMHVLPEIVALVRANRHFLEFLHGARLVPVPLHARKQRERGFNQAELLARLLAAEASGAVVQPLLRRVVDTPTQTRLDREQRQENLKNAFALLPEAPLEPGFRYVLVDDVFTTGATLNACASVLRRAGLSHVDVATLGHG